MDFKPLGAKIVPNGGRIKEGLDRSSFLAEKNPNHREQKIQFT